MNRGKTERGERRSERKERSEREGSEERKRRKERGGIKERGGETERGGTSILFRKPIQESLKKLLEDASLTTTVSFVLRSIAGIRQKEQARGRVHPSHLGAGDHGRCRRSMRVGRRRGV